jgi:uncharacterized protein (DUF488 family)
MQIFTIGYEGFDQTQFLSWLSNYKVNVVADVRDLPLSRKKGFSKSALSELLEKNKIAYINYRELGAPKELRNFLFQTRDYETYFKKYKNIVAKNLATIDTILDTIKDGKNVALLCYEKDPSTCHRSVVADEVKKRDGNGLKIKHLGLV